MNHRVITSSDLAKCKAHNMSPRHWIPEHKLEECDKECKNHLETILETLNHVHQVQREEFERKHKELKETEVLRIRKRYLNLRGQK